MFDRIRNFLSSRPSLLTDASGEVGHWASSRFLHYRAHGPQQFDIQGRLLERDLRVECAPSSRDYIVGLELRARFDLALPPAGHVIVLSRTLLRTLQTQAETFLDPSRSRGRRGGRELPEELRWLEWFQEARWKGPGDRFWERYAVLSDAPELARRWLDDEAQAFLLAGDSEASVQVPILVALMRGKCYLRLQVNPHADEADALLALELLEYLGQRALVLAAGVSATGRGPLSSRG